MSPRNWFIKGDGGVGTFDVKNLFFFYFSSFPVNNVKLPLNHSLIDWVAD